MIPYIVVPSNRPERMSSFLSDWKEEFQGCHVIFVFDLPKLPDIKIPISLVEGFEYSSYSWEEIDEDLKENAWIISRGSSAIRSYGFYRAYQESPLFIVTLDDDTKPSGPGHIREFYSRLFCEHKTPDTSWFNTLKGTTPRGTPFMEGTADVVHGGWLGVPDLSAKEQIRLDNPSCYTRSDFNEGYIPKGCLFSMCGMNLAFKPEVTRFMYFGLQGKEYPVSRADDIMAGMFLTSKSNFRVYTGSPFVIHNRASNCWNNLRKEKLDEKIISDWQILLNNAPYLLYSEYKEYFDKLLNAYEIWGGLFK